MFIGWIRQNSFVQDLEQLSQTILIDTNLVFKTAQENQSLCFGAYDSEQNLVAIITAYQFENSFLINNLYYTKEVESQTIVKLFELLLKNRENKNTPVLFMANQYEQDTLDSFGFKRYANFTKVVYGFESVAFNFTNATSKSISNPNYIPTIKKLNTNIFKEDRLDYILHIVAKQSSLMLSTQFGYQHSYALSKDMIKISPWIMVDEAFTDAEKLLRGVLYHRGLKTIIAFIPSNKKEITDLYKSYKFQFKEEYSLLYLNKKPNWNLDCIYGF